MLHGQLRNFFDTAKTQGWRMTWKAWKTVTPELGGWFVLDDDSRQDENAVLDAADAKTAFFHCTIGPQRMRQPCPALVG